jgi:ATP synthase
VRRINKTIANLSISFVSNVQIRAAGLKEVRDRIESVKNTQKITEAMKLVAAAKVRRAQDAVINGRPFAENLVKVRYILNILDLLIPLIQPSCCFYLQPSHLI